MRHKFAKEEAVSSISPGPLVTNTVVTHVPSLTSEHIDGANDILSVARSSSDIFRRNESVLKGDLTALLRHCATRGENTILVGMGCLQE